MKKILLVDDEMTSTRLLRLGLERTGLFEVREQNQSRRVLDTAREFQPDLVVMDVCMPGMDGGDVARALRSQPEFRNLPIIFLTSMVSDDDAGGQPLKSGGFVFLPKPVNLTQLLIEIDRQLAATAVASNA
ncbi:MAG: response regulator [Verrucomicrobiae bacterium]|nr:response regulator [Verrucomicrobiae bacterium]